jgi:PGF-pre-PGF domain-containing protein
MKTSIITVLLCALLLLSPTAFANGVWRYYDSIAVDKVSTSSNGEYSAISTTAGIEFLDGSGNVQWSKAVGYVNSISLSSDGSYLAVGADSAYLYDRSGNLKWNYGTGRGVEGVAVAPGGSYVAIGSYTDVYLVGINANTIWKKTVCSQISDIAISSDNNYIAIASSDCVTVFDSSGNVVANYKAGGSSISVSTTGTYTAVGSKDSNLYFFFDKLGNYWKFSTADKVVSVSLASDGNVVVLASGLNLYMLNTFYLLSASDRALWSDAANQTVSSAQLSTDGTRLIYACGNEVGMDDVSSYLPAFIYAVSSPSEADVYIDGSLKGKTPITVTVAEGTHTVDLMKYGYTDVRQTVTVSKGSPGNLYVTMKLKTATSTPTPTATETEEVTETPVVTATATPIKTPTAALEEETQNITYLGAGNKKSLEYKLKDVSRLDVTVEKTVRNAEITIKKVEEPEGIKEEPKVLYGYFVASAKNMNASDVKKATFWFKVDRQWMNDNDINSSSVKLYRFSNRWETLPTSKLSEDTSYAYYSADSYSLSVFAIVGERSSTPWLSIIPIDLSFLSGVAKWTFVILVLVGLLALAIVSYVKLRPTFGRWVLSRRMKRY